MTGATELDEANQSGPPVIVRIDRLVRRQRTGFDLRREKWCEAVGMQPSRARQTAVLKWLPRYSVPEGFDHTGVYYWPGGKLHFLLTEPYHSTERALLSLRALATQRRMGFSFAVGAAGTGLWNPGACIPLLVGPEGDDYELECFAAGLPTAAECAA